jgi:membrane-bound lytic murein transglycosylase B
MNRRPLRAAVLALALVLAPAPAPAAEPFSAWLDAFKAEALRQRIGRATLEAAFAGVEPIARVIELDRRQIESRLTFEEYMERVVPPARIAAAQERYLEHKALLDAVAERFGVPAPFIVALWGIESDFGRNPGGYPVVAALATLAHEGRRGAYFRGELLHALRILEAGHVSVPAMQGSWAGAMGQCQFMPSSFHAYAQDFDGDGRRDIWGNLADVFASTANYLARAGWRDNETWGRRVALPEGFDARLADREVRKSLAEWRALGIRGADGGDLPELGPAASIVLPPKSQPGTAYLVHDNFRALLKWNRSLYFALAVGRLSDAVAAVR